MRALRRLNAIALLIDNANVVADIGCDHGFLGKILLKSGKAKKIIAIDINSQSLAKAEKLARKVHLQDKIETRLGDGLNPISDQEVDVVVIAGLGGHTIIDILKQKVPAGIKEYILQPAQKSELLKEFLQKNNFKIIYDFIVKDKNKFYNTIKVVKIKNQICLSEEEKLFCLTDFDLYNSDILEYIDLFIERNQQISLSNKSNEILNQIEMAEKLKERILKEEELKNARNN